MAPQGKTFFFRSQPIGTITLDSSLPPGNVLDKLRTHGREWRPSAVRPELKKAGITGLHVRMDGSGFEMKCLSLPAGWNPERTWPVIVIIPDAEREFRKTATPFAGRAAADALLIQSGR